ncbi:MAG: hypothetical protein HYS05_01665, partial [Acidobacteria bacterium]|nr:hypothetical protein [Acidobacteriota bacterium]
MTLRFSRFSPSFLVVAIGLVSTLFPATTAHAGATRTGATFAVGAGARFPDAAFDPANNVYFVIWGRLSGSIGGRFVAPDGTPLGAAFRIPTVGDWAETGRVAYSPDTGGFLVTWLDTRANANFGQVWGRLVAYSAGGSPTFLTSDFMIAAAPGGARPGTAPAVAYATTSKAFLVTWQQAGSNRFDIRAQRVSNAGALLGSEIVITNDADWQDTPTVVYNSALDEFFVVWIHYDTIARLQSRRVTAGTGALPTAPVTIDTGSLLAAPEVQFDPVRNVYLVAWYSDGGPSARIEYARFMSSDGTAGAAKFPVGVGYVSYDGLGMARNTASGVYFVIFNGTGTESVGAEVSTTGTPGSVMQVTATGSPLGNFGPRVTTSATAREWLAVVATGYTTASAQRLATDAPLISGSGSPPAPAPVPAPTPSPTPSPNPTPTPTLHTLSIQRGGSGTVTGSGINCGGSCSAQFAAGTQIILTPSPAAGFVFAGWTGDNDCFDGIIDIVGATSCVAHFTRDQGSASRRVADPNGDAVGDLFLHNQTTGVWYIAHGDVDGFNYSRGNWSRDWVVRAANLNSDDLT